MDEATAQPTYGISTPWERLVMLFRAQTRSKDSGEVLYSGEELSSDQETLHR